MSKPDPNAALSARMKAVADRDGLPSDHPLRVRAREFDEAVKKYMAQPQQMAVRAFMGYWARARRSLSDYTGQDILTF